MLNLGILAAGGIARKMAKTITSVDCGVRPYAVAARDGARAAAFAKEFGFETSYEGYDALLADPAVDVVYVATTHNFHKENVRAALEAGKTLAVPLCMGPGVMQARAVRSLEELAPAGPYGIPEPPAGAPEVPPQRLALCVLPCLAAAPDGTRLGYGGGYYDRFLPLACNAVKIALCRAALLEPVLPRECHDVRADFVLTEDALYGCKGGG